MLFSCNVTKAGGAGHLMRSISLAEQARAAGHEVSFCGSFETEFAHEALNLRDFGFTSIRSSDSLLGLALAERVDLVHCDDYDADEDLHASHSSRGILFSNVEDGTFGRRSADFILDPSADAERTYRSGAPSATHLRGLDYVPLRGAVIDAAKARVRNFPSGRLAGTFRVLLMLGGTDAAGFTQMMAELWAEAVPNSVCYAVLPGLKAGYIEQTVSGQIEWLPSSENIVSLFSEIDAAIVAAGTTAWELAAARIPTALIMQATNQSENYNYLVGRGMMLGLGHVENLMDNSTNVRLTMKRLSGGWAAPKGPGVAPVIDALGPHRVVSEWNHCVKSQQRLTIREGRLSDASVLFDWRNDERVRLVSRDTRTLSWEEHVDWLQSSLTNPKRMVFVAHIGAAPVGTVRYDQSDSDLSDWEVSIALNPERRGSGLGRRLLAASDRLLLETLGFPIRIRAVVRTENNASNRLFETSGYCVTTGSEADGFRTWCRKVS
ncbi:GNAT family N-acetyltransferase [Pseudarthrobacter phenanthrenivorans]|uniref:GNAT family N-acetyltransferase n=1 Tax=Pseudarthrobacter phenanthrenivorans TaxID=361575 RepID=A0A3B0FST6_PSEPS|nr:bifunctional UDP-2,4-diacetamido-2,4,6-trideoxy-beta-L-altropyranose hydrolase/GNAT family N-acetyltransferase [Pseudarthrobacter phenanthrenivorans]RKO21527.1 GNAT family N-acetyltransferase [Pseudarthrobacter phenanthrenivorans]